MGWKTKMVLVVLVVLVAGIQLVPVQRDNPPERAPIAGPPEVVQVLEQSCFDCHSNRTRWPWYSRLAPVSWLVARDVNDGRSHLNFSNWELFDAPRRAELGRRVWEEVEKGEMPLGIYLLLHEEADLDPQDRDTLREWAAETPPAGREEGKDTGGYTAPDD